MMANNGNEQQRADAIVDRILSGEIAPIDEIETIGEEQQRADAIVEGILNEPQAPDVRIERHPDVQTLEHPQDAIPLSLKGLRRVLINQGVNPQEIDAIVQQYEQAGAQPRIEVLPLREALTEAASNFPSNFWQNLKNTVDPRNIPGILRFGWEILKGTEPPPFTVSEGTEPTPTAVEDSAVNALLSFYAETFDVTSPEGREIFKRYLAESPSEFLSDAAMILGPIGGMAVKTGRVAPLANRLNASKVLKPMAIGAEIAVDPGKVADVALRTGGAIIESIPGPQLTEEVNGEMLRLQQEMRADIPRGFPEGVLSTDPRVVSAEAQRVKTGFFSGARKRLREFDVGINAIANRTIEAVGGLQDIGQVGESIFTGFRETIDTFHNESRALFDSVPDIWEAPADYNATIATIDAILDRNKGPISSLDTEMSRLRTLRERLDKAMDAGATVKDIDFERTRFREIFMRERRSKDLAVLPESRSYQLAIYNALTDDIYNAAEKVDASAVPVLRRAKAKYAEGVKRLNTAYGDKIIELGSEGRFDELAKELLKPKFLNRSVIPELIDNIGPEAANQLRANYLDQLLSKSRTANGNFTPTGLANQLSKQDGVVLELLFGQETRQTLESIAQIMLESQELKSTLGGSQTAWNLAAMDKASAILAGAGASGEILYSMLTGSGALPDTQTLAVGLSMFFGREAYRAFIDSEFSRQWRFEGFDFPAAGKVEALGRQIRQAPRQLTRPVIRLGAVTGQQQRQSQETIRQRQE